MKTRTISTTANYRIFTPARGENRPLDLKKHKKLAASMERYGFLSCFPIVVVRHESGALEVKDGQHRLAIAEKLGIPVHYTIADTDFDVAVINSTAKIWTLQDYAKKHAANGLDDYLEGLDFAQRHGLPIGTAFSLLSGTTSFTNVQDRFVSGDFRILDREWADAVAGIYSALTRITPDLKNARFVDACMAVCRVEDFDPNRLIRNAGRCREKLQPYSTKDAYLDMLEAVYNFGQHRMVGLKAAALMAMRERNAAMKSMAAKRRPRSDSQSQLTA